MAKTLSGFRNGMSGDNNLQASGNAQNVAVVTGLEGLRQSILMKLRMWQGEWDLARQDGVPYLQEIFARTSDVRTTIITSIIRSDPEVTGVHNIQTDLDRETRKGTYSCTVSSIHGEFNLVTGL